ncbi:MAG: hypothetical protein V3U24_11385 [Candidatus Neomarinimicrobiota bacterium]
MKTTDKLIIAACSIFLLMPVSAQFKSQLPENRAEKQPSVSLEDLERFSINHGFSLNMAVMGGQSVSYGVYSNRLRYLISDKWTLHGSFDLLQPTNSRNPYGVNSFNGQVFYGANLLYRPTENLQLSIGVDNYPRYRYYSYSPFARYHE